MTEDYNPLKADEVSGGPALGWEEKLEKVISKLYPLIGTHPKIEEVLNHEQTLLNETGPRRNFDNRNDRRRKRLHVKGIK